MDKPRRFRQAVQGKKARNQLVYGVFVAAESVDPNLSQVNIPGGDPEGNDLVLRFVPKGAHVTGLVAGSSVLMAGRPQCIIARVIGNTRLAEI